MNNEHLVSIILTTLNCVTYLQESINSCLNQTYTNLELIVVDGGSTDGTLEVITEFKDPRIRIVHQKKNTGKLPGALNMGLDCAKGDYLTWMQGDSLYHLSAIERMVGILVSHEDIGQVYANYWVIDSDGKILRIQKTCEPEEIITAKSDPAGVCFLIRHSIREVIGPHDIEAYPCQDYDYRLRIALKYKSFHLDEPLYSWRIHSNSLTGRIPWNNLAHKDTQIRFKLGISDAKLTRKDHAFIDISYAFEKYQCGSFRLVPGFIWSGVRQDWSYVFNFGVWSILGKSIYQLSKFRLFNPYIKK